MSTETTTLDLLELAELVARSGRDAVQSASTPSPAERAATVSVKQLIAEAPALPPLNQRSITGKTITALLTAGSGAAVIQDRRGVRVAHLDGRLLDDPTVIVLTDHAEAFAATSERTLRDGTKVPGQREVDFARDVLARELDAYDYATAA